MNDSNMTRPVLISGITFGVLTAIPPFSILNACTCCSLYAAAGFLASYLLRKESPTPLKTGQGAMVGLISGIIGGVVHTAFSIPMALLVQSLFPVNQELMEKALEALGDDNSPLAKLLREFGSRGAEMISLFSLAWFLMILVKLVVIVILFGVFAMLGGILGVAILEKKNKATPYLPPPPAPSTEEPPPAPPWPPTPTA